MPIIKKVSPSPKIKHLKLNPLSVAKFFWEKGIEDMALMQRILYLLFFEVLKKESCLLFEEEWQAWPHGPVIESVFDKMFDHRHNLKKLFSSVEDIDSKLALDYADTTYRKYQNTEQYLIFEKAQNKPWKDARKPLKSEKQTAKIPLNNLIKFANGKSSRITA